MADAIYLITEGEYSDYHVVAAYTTREKAEEAIERLRRLGYSGRSDPEIEEFPLDGTPRYQPLYYCIVEVETGEVLREWETNQLLWSEEAMPPDEDADWTWGGRLVVRGGTARGAEVARKIAFDKRTQILAEREGV